jgi:4-amino-4-deoxy-L-arabinose transferase-like glycosyltransferase
MEPNGKSTSIWSLVGITLLGGVIFGLRLAGPDDLMSHAQYRQAAYVMDAVHNGHWTHQYDAYGNISSKPPLYTWLAGGISELAGEVNEFTLTLPAALATIGLAMLV